ncbi:7062_t:CDS:10 [Gigaspora margarita]|uniref:7062_t:CDS:1 n=1 Tax=Gigaspora margarita TaxID=4874 RepID=A0ABN7UFY8_GIGMA|nr:7062_t:CDS:10 [Gigaspora margarita]
MSWFTDKIEQPNPIVNLLKSKQAIPSPPPRPITVSIVGAGQRGTGYAYYTILEPQWAKVVAVAEPVDIRRNRMVKLYNIPEENVFKDWKEMIERPKLSDAVVIATLDDLHVEPAVAFANKKYNILLEKPMAITVEGCKKITKAVTENEKISSFGNLVHFNSKNKPKEAGDAKNCLECKIESTCPYSAKKIYIDNCYKKGVVSWPVNVVTDIPDIENLTNALKNGPYGRCVYECDNDVADNQVVNLEFANGEIEGDGINTIMYYNFLTRKKELLKPSEILGVNNLGGHAGGDLALIRSFIYSIGESLFDLKDINSSHIKTGAQQTFGSHLFAFAVEHSRKTGNTINIEDFKKMWGIS